MCSSSSIHGTGKKLNCDFYNALSRYDERMCARLLEVNSESLQLYHVNKKNCMFSFFYGKFSLCNFVSFKFRFLFLFLF